MKLLKQNILLFLMCLGVLTSCQKKWDDHNAVQDPNFNVQLVDRIKENPELSKFMEYLEQTKYADTLRSSKTYTVWAPTNAALQSLDPAVINTEAKLKLFVANHIANQSFLTSAAAKNSFLRIKTLNNKSLTFTPTSIDGSVMTSKDLYLGNGVLHVISSAIVPKLSAWELLMSTNTLQKQQLQSLTYTVYDPELAEITGIDPLTGKPIRKPGTGFFTTNRFLQREDVSSFRRADISKEDSTFTYIILTDAAFSAEKIKLEKYFKTSKQDTTDSLTKFNIIKDLAFKGLLDKDNFPASVLSVGDSVRFYLNKNAIVETHNVSNGIVYVMSSINYDLGNGTFDKYAKIKPIVIQGESVNNSVNANLSLSNVRLTNGTFQTPVRRNPDGSIFTQVYRFNHGQAINWTRYRPAQVNSVKYKVFWRVVRDYNLEPVAKALPLVVNSRLIFSPLRFAIGDPLVITPGFNYILEPGALPVLNSAKVHQIHPVTGKFLYEPDYEEKLIGEFTAPRYYSNTLLYNDKLRNQLISTLAIYQVGSTSTVNGANDLLLDYIKLVPVP
jgi:uncharacterized surface protein with fasciclin (FAS1) repeats